MNNMKKYMSLFSLLVGCDINCIVKDGNCVKIKMDWKEGVLKSMNGKGVWICIIGFW